MKTITHTRINISLSAIALACSLGMVGCATTQKAAVDTVATNPNSVSASFVMPSYQSVTLDNGLKVKLMVQKEVPLVTIDAVIRAGAVNDVVPGLAYITSQSLMLGAGDQSKADIEQQLDFLGASIDTNADLEGSYVRANMMSKDVDTVLDIFSHVLRQPDFDTAEFDKLKQREIVGLAQQKESPRAVIGRYFNKLVFGQHLYANPVSGNSDTIAKLSVAELRAFHKGYYQPSNMTINVVGDFDIVDMTAKLNKAFGDWQATESVIQPDLNQNLPTLTKPRVLLVDKPDAIETTFLIGGVGIRYDNPDYVGLAVVNTILGGRFTSWLNDELRVNAGLTYGARSGFSPYAQSGVFKISTFTQSSTTKEAIDLALKTYARLWEKGIDQATLDSAKAYVKGQFPPKYETSGQLAGLLSDMYLYGFNDDFINQFQAKVDGLTLVETQRLIKQYFPQQNLQFVLIGNAEKIADIVVQYGEVTKVDITATGFGQ
ncbi:M16 family metallopeptidase [Shewanella sp. A14]